MEHSTQVILSFLSDIGIPYKLEPIKGYTFLPGVKMSEGTLIIDIDQLLYPGDILHEAGHLACMPPEIRKEMSDNLPNNDLHAGGEMMAIGWSYAACIYLKLDAELVFHEHGYKGGLESLLENFEQSRFIGVPLLQWLGMTFDEQNAKTLGFEPYPIMQQWICKDRSS
ncbi:MAG: hypothetical protein EOP54_15295 [Sphingobacteriales bacterium]|nr:MAG: hypothetical protein EOP54_15295 [Sphingobacteriales bacterium]